MTAISVAIVTYNSRDVIEPCLAAIDYAQDVVVVDNASTDDTRERASRHRARVVANAENLGFGTALNIAMRHAAHDLVLWLNPDAVVERASLVRLVEAAQAYPDAGMLGPRIREGADGAPAPYPVATMLERKPPPSAPRPGHPTGDCCVPFLSAAVALVRRSAFEAVGGFDEEIFLYYEDDDLCRRFLDARIALVQVEAAEARHIGGGSSGNSLTQAYRKGFAMAQSARHVRAKHGIPAPRDKNYFRLAVLHGLALRPARAAQAFGRWRGGRG